MSGLSHGAAILVVGACSGATQCQLDARHLACKLATVGERGFACSWRRPAAAAPCVGDDFAAHGTGARPPMSACLRMPRVDPKSGNR